MKGILLLFGLFGGTLLSALPPPEEIEFRFEPSFADGTLVWLGRVNGGKIHCTTYTLPIVADGGVASHNKAKPVLVREVEVSAAEFEALAGLIEGQRLRAEAEKAEPVGVDGTNWVFRRKAGGRVLELRFWTPENRKGSAAFSLGTKFMAVAQVKNTLPLEPDNPVGEVPILVPTDPFVPPKH